MLHLISFDENNFEEIKGDFKDIFPLHNQSNHGLVRWIDIDVDQDSELELLAQHYKLHHLTLEDIRSQEQLPKFESFESYFFLTLKMMHHEKDELVMEQVSFVCGKNFIISFQEIPGDVFETVRSRLSLGQGYVRKRGSDYLFIRLLDSIVDHYGLILEHARERISDLEDEIFLSKKSDILVEVMEIKKMISSVRRYIFPLKESLIKLKVEADSYFSKYTHNYLNDIQDQLNYQLSYFDNLRDMLKDLQDLHNSKLNVEMNKVMKTLTVFTVIFIPLTFLVGVYGMNFKFMPELNWYWGYPLSLIIMFVIAVSMLLYMKNKKWL